MREKVTRKKSFEFAVLVVKTCDELMKNQKEFIMSKQFLKCSTSIGANVREAENAESRADFIHKLSIAQKECNETNYWIDLLRESGYLNEEKYNDMSLKGNELMKLITSSIRTAKKNRNKSSNL